MASTLACLYPAGSSSMLNVKEYSPYLIPSIPKDLNPYSSSMDNKTSNVDSSPLLNKPLDKVILSSSMVVPWIEAPLKESSKPW